METEQILNRILIGCRTTKPKVITAANQYKGKYHKQPIRIQSKKEQTTESAGKREWPSRGWFYFTFDWLKVWWEFSAPITGRMKSKTNAFADKVAQFFLPFVSVIDMSLSFCTATSSSDSLPGLFVFISMSAIKPLLLLLLLAGLICWSILIDSGIGLREFCVPLYLWLPEKGKKRKRSTYMLAHRNLTMLWFDNTRHSNQGWKKKKHFHISPKLVSLVFDFDGLSTKLNSFMLSKKFQEMAKGYQKLCLEENTLTCI